MFKGKSPKEKELNDKIDKISKNKSLPNSQASFIRDLMPYCPESNSRILNKLTGKFVENLKNPIGTNEVASATADLIIHMIEQSDLLLQEMSIGARSINDPADKKVEQKTPEFVPYPPFLSDKLYKSFFENLFGQTAVYEDKILFIIEKFYAFDGLKFVKWILTLKQPQKTPLYNIYALVARTQSLRAGRIVHLLTVSNPDVKKLLTPLVKPFLRQFPVAIVIDLMVSSQEIKEVIPSVEFEGWLLTHERFTLSDIDIVTGFYKIIWLAETSVKLLLLSDPPEKMSDIKWISTREAQDFEMTQEVVNTACKALKPTFAFKKGPDCASTRDPYMFVRIFIISLANPEKVMLETRNLIIELIKDKNEYVAAAATQCIIYWVLKFNFKVKPSIIFRVAAAAVDDNVSEPLKYVYMSALHVFGKQFDVATTILQVEDKLRFLPKYKIKMIRNAWIFPHFKKHVEEIFAIKLCDYNQATDVISYISGYLCNVDEDKPEIRKDEASSQILVEE